MEKSYVLPKRQKGAVNHDEWKSKFAGNWGLIKREGLKEVCHSVVSYSLTVV